MTFDPDYVVHPGETLKEVMRALHLDVVALARRTSYPDRILRDVIRGRAPITSGLALRLEETFGISAAFWRKLQRNYTRRLARLKGSA